MPLILYGIMIMKIIDLLIDRKFSRFNAKNKKREPTVHIHWQISKSHTATKPNLVPHAALFSSFDIATVVTISLSEKRVVNCTSMKSGES